MAVGRTIFLLSLVLLITLFVVWMFMDNNRSNSCSSTTADDDQTKENQTATSEPDTSSIANGSSSLFMEREENSGRIITERDIEAEAKAWYEQTIHSFEPGSESEVWIGSAHCNRIEFLEAQYHSLKAFLKQPFTMVVINDARDSAPEKRDAIEQFCRENNIIHIRFYQALHKYRRIIFPNSNEIQNDHPTTRCCDGVQLMYRMFCETQKRKPNQPRQAMILDSDLMPFQSFRVTDLFGTNEPRPAIAALEQSRSTVSTQRILPYLWVGVLAFDLSRIVAPEDLVFDCGRIVADGEEVGIDAGGTTWYYLYKHTPSFPDSDVPLQTRLPHFISLLHHGQVTHPILLPLTEQIGKQTGKEFYEDFENFHDIFIHYCGGTLYKPTPPHIVNERIEKFKNYIIHLTIVEDKAVRDNLIY